MRHRWGTFSRLGRDTRHRKALLKNLATALIKHERIVTTLAKAKQLRRVGDKVCSLVVDARYLEISRYLCAYHCMFIDDNIWEERYRKL